MDALWTERWKHTSLLFLLLLLQLRSSCLVYFPLSWFLSLFYIIISFSSSLVDIWSVGCIMAELLTGKVIFPGNDCILHSLYIPSTCLSTHPLHTLYIPSACPSTHPLLLILVLLPSLVPCILFFLSFSQTETIST